MSIEDGDRAVAMLEKSVEMTPPTHPDVAMRLNNLGNALLARFERLRSMRSILEAKADPTAELFKDLSRPSRCNEISDL
jgi:hypothetical protein